MPRTIEQWQEMITDYSTKWKQTRLLANRPDIIVIAQSSGWSSHKLILSPTGHMEGKRFIGDPTKPFYLRVYDTQKENATLVDPVARTYTWGKYLWSNSIWPHNWCLPPGLQWQQRYATRYVSGGIELRGNYDGPLREFVYGDDNRMVIHAPLGSQRYEVTGGEDVVMQDVSPEKVARMAKLKRDLLAVIRPYEQMRISGGDSPLFHKDIIEPLTRRPMKERFADVLELLNHDELYMQGYQTLIGFGSSRWWYQRTPTTEQVFYGFMQQMKRHTYVTTVDNT